MASQLGYPPNQKDGVFSSRFAVYIFEKKKTGLEDVWEEGCSTGVLLASRIDLLLYYRPEYGMPSTTP